MQYEKVTLSRDPKDHTFRGFVFVTMMQAGDTSAVVNKLNGYELKGKVIRAQLAKRDRPRTPTPGTYLGVRDPHHAPVRFEPHRLVLTFPLIHVLMFVVVPRMTAAKMMTVAAIMSAATRCATTVATLIIAKALTVITAVDIPRLPFMLCLIQTLMTVAQTHTTHARA